MVSTVSVRGQTAIPAIIRKRYHIDSGASLEWVDDGFGIGVVPVPKDPLKALRGKFKGAGLGQELKELRTKERADG